MKSPTGGLDQWGLNRLKNLYQSKLMRLHKLDSLYSRMRVANQLFSLGEYNEFNSGYSLQNSHFSQHAQLPALRIAAIQASFAAVHHDDGGGAALRAELRPFREVRL